MKTKLKVEVRQGERGTRVLARLFPEASEAGRFFENTCSAHQQRANREGISFLVRMTVVQERPAKELSLVEERGIDPRR